MSDLSAVAAGSHRRSGASFGCRVALGSVLRSVRLLMTDRPQTPLRALCIAAFDMLHVLRCSTRLTREQSRLLATVLDYGAHVNAELDSKPLNAADFRAARQELEAAGLGRLVEDYRIRLQQQERQRPAAGGQRDDYVQVELYREAIVRLSLGMLAAMVFDLPSVEAGFQATNDDEALRLLVRIVMQCQIIDDVLDYSADAAAGLPGFLTVPDSLPEAYDLIKIAAIRYGDSSVAAPHRALFPLRVALMATSVCARLAIVFGRWRHVRLRSWTGR